VFSAALSVNRKKILNRGNKLEVLLKTKELTDTRPSKQTPFCGGELAIKAKKMAFQPEFRGRSGLPS
jgi:hypothetical protein